MSRTQDHGSRRDEFVPLVTVAKALVFERHPKGNFVTSATSPLLRNDTVSCLLGFAACLKDPKQFTHNDRRPGLEPKDNGVRAG